MESKNISSNQKPCVFITGISGNLGEVLCKKLCDNGFKCKGLVRDEEAKKEVQSLGCCDVFVGDLCKLQTDDFTKFIDGCDYVIDAAGSTSGKDIEKVEFVSGRYLAQAAMKKNVKKYISMSAVGCDRFLSGDRSSALSCEKCKNSKEFAENQYKLDEFIQNETQNLDYLIVRSGDLTDEKPMNKILIGRPHLSPKYSKTCHISREDLANLLVCVLKNESLKRMCFEVINCKEEGMPIQEAIKQLNVAL